MSSAEISTNPIPTPVVEKKPGVRHIIDNTKYPDYIRNHAVFNKFDKISKVFPSIGLPNISGDCPYSNIIEARTDATNLLYSDIRLAIYGAMGQYGVSEAIRILLSQIYANIGSYYPQMILEEEGRLTLKFNMDVGTWDGKVFAKKGEGVFKVYNKLVEKCKAINSNIVMMALEAMPYFKAFSSSNVPSGKKFKTVFSASGQEGAWDIATISMRGISSCQGWGSSQSRGLIGSISSKYVGVLYITGGDPFNEYGSKMLRRAMVRFCVNKITKTPALLIDKVYPGDDLSVRSIFREFLKTKITIPVLFPGDTGWADYCLPVDSYWKAAPLASNEYTYMDTKIPWKNTPTPKDMSAFYQSIAHLDTALASKVHNKLVKMLDEYCIDKKTHREQFKGGVANLVFSMKKNLGSHYNFMGHFLPKLYNHCSAAGAGLLPKPETFENIKEYERAVIKGVFKNMKSFDIQTKDGCMKMGKFMKFFPTSADKLTKLVVSEYKKELVNRYRELVIN